MTERSEKIPVNNGILNQPPDFIIPEASRYLLVSIEGLLSELVDCKTPDPCDDEFYFRFLNVLDLYDRFQREILAASGINVVCSAGCAECCCHWVEDVNSFEGYIISRYLRENHPDIIDSVIGLFREDAEVIASLKNIVDEKITGYSSLPEEIPDKYELLLSCFYQLERPCALLDENGRCVVYPVRPLTCRDYMNIRDPEACLPERINEDGNATLIMHISDSIAEHIEILNRRFDQGCDDMSLRGLLVRILEPGCSSCRE